MNNCYWTAKRILHLLEVPHTDKFLKDLILSHPDSESLLSIVDTLTKYQITSLPVKIGIEKLDQISLPCVIQIKQDEGFNFYCLTGFSENEVEYLDERGKIKKLSLEEFKFKWTGVALFVEKSELSSEPDYDIKFKEQRFSKVLYSLLIISIIALLGIIVVDWAGPAPLLILFILLIFLKAAGLIISSILLWYEVDNNNPTLKEYCSGGKRVNCDAVLNSGSIAGVISLSNLAFGYFFSGFLMLLITSFSISSILILNYMSFLSIPIIIGSLYYQRIKIKNWCIFCLWILAVLTAEFVVLRAIGISGQFLVYDLISFSFLFVLSIIAWVSVKPHLLNHNKLYYYKRGIAKFKTDREVFGYLLTKSKKVLSNPDGLGITFLNPTAKYQVLKVCNPYCGPCARAHPVLEHLYDAGFIDLQILFVPEENLEDTKTKTISHFKSLSQEYDEDVTKQALSSWYGTKRKDILKFADIFKVKATIEQNHEKLMDMRAWCKQEKISHTPTIYINGYLLPETFTVDDLPYVLN